MHTIPYLLKRKTTANQRQPPNQEAYLQRKVILRVNFTLSVQENMWKIRDIWKHATHYIY
jgi:hypothetical protein